MPNDTLLNTGTGGDTIAADEVTTLNGAASSGVKVQRIKVGFGVENDYSDVERDNPLPTTIVANAPAYRLYVPSQAAGANKVYFDLFNAAGSGKIVRIKSIRGIKNGSIAVTGTLGVLLHFTRTSTVGTGGTAATTEGSSLTAITFSSQNLSNAAIPAQITARASPGGGATAGAVLSQRVIFPEETNASSYEGVEFVHGFNDVQSTSLAEGQGIRIVQGTVASVGNIGFDVIFELE